MKVLDSLLMTSEVAPGTSNTNDYNSSVCTDSSITVLIARSFTLTVT